MPTINIGLSGYIDYQITNNNCYNTNYGSIVIGAIVFNDLYPQFTSYTVNWTANNHTIDSNQIRDNGKALINLYADNYSFTIDSLISNDSLGPYSVTVSDPVQFGITRIKSSNFSCGDNGNIFIEISGGSPPYSYLIGQVAETTSNTEYMATGLEPGSYNITITDSNGCEIDNLTDISNTIIIKNSTFTISAISTLPPQILDGYGQLNLTIQGEGPFLFSFIHDNESSTINIDNLNTEYLINHDIENNTYTYSFKNILNPGNYILNIKNNNNCLISQSFNIPNLEPISATINILPNSSQGSSAPKNLTPIFDTIFIPFIHIQNNTDLWKLIQKFIKQNKIIIKISDQIVEYKISKSFLYPYCIDTNRIEIVRLDNDPHNWYFCFHISPGINLLDNTSLIGSEMFLVDTDNNQEFICVFGLDTNDHISHEYASLLMGSLTLLGSNHEEFYDGTDAYLKINETLLQNTNEYDFQIKNIKTGTYTNLLQYITSIYFLDNFNTLIENIAINQTACNISSQDYQYIINIKQLLLAINNFNNYNNLYIFNDAFMSNTGSVSVFITGSPTIPKNDILVNNLFSIEYFTFNKLSKQLSSFYRNNNKISNVSLLDHIPNGYIILRIKDLNNNKVNYINTNNVTLNYDEHFLGVKNLLQIYNPYIKDLFEYGDILVYVPLYSLGGGLTIPDDTIGIVPSPQTPPTPPTPPDITKNIIKQSADETNTSILNIETLPQNAICYLLGPKNYKQKFIGSTIFQNLIPGVYTIVGDEDYLSKNYLYQNNLRTIILDNQEYNINIRFISYLDKIFIKE